MRNTSLRGKGDGEDEGDGTDKMMPPAAREKLFEKSFSLDSLQKLLTGHAEHMHR
jgi:hypothetical protein